MKKLTFKQAEKLHKELWGWLAETGEPLKSSWPEWKRNGGKIPDIRHQCFACDLVHYECERCPMDWSGKEDDFFIQCCAGGAEFWMWCKSQTANTRKKYAAIIRDLPWKKRGNK